jgi:hypothetical protein
LDFSADLDRIRGLNDGPTVRACELGEQHAFLP